MHGSRIAALLVAVVIVAWSGCTQQQVEQTVRRVADTAERISQPSSYLEFRLEPEDARRTGACYAVLVGPGTSRPSVLQITTYDQPEAESYPSVYLRARASAAKWADLAGQQLEAELYAQLGPGDAIWRSTPAHPVILQVTTVDDQRIEGSFQGGPVGNSRNQQQRNVAGSFRASCR